MVVEAFEGEGGDARRVVDVRSVLAVHRLQDQVVGARLDALADDLGDRRLDEGGTLGDQLRLHAIDDQHRGGVTIERRLCAKRRGDLLTLLGHLGAAFLDLVAALSVREAALVEHLAPLPEMLVTLGDDRLGRSLHRGEALRDLLHRRLMRVQRGHSRLGHHGGGLLIRIGEGLTHLWQERRRRRCSPPRAHDNRNDSAGGQQGSDDDQDDCDVIWEGGGRRSGARREVEGFAGLGDQPLGKEIGGWWKGSPPIPAEGHGTRDRRVTKRDDRHARTRDGEWHRHERGAEAGFDKALNDREVVTLDTRRGW